MADKDLDRIYTASGDAEMRELYDKWADDYDSDVVGNGYLTPTRIADALGRLVPDRDVAVMDHGCGTGLSGVALDEAGFSRIDGADLSQKMLDRARECEVYRTLDLIEPDAPLPDRYAQYPVIVAAGVISKGAAPPSLYGDLITAMRPGALLAFSVNDLSLAEPDYAKLVDRSAEAGEVKVLHDEHGPHLTGYEENNGSKVYVVEKLAR
ncbi:methyltransferase domain-containing protein [Qipengyuania sp. JC766]|uniref:class I SAM-dependent DNA methyltransferase n=1 Tax=Qipengyuania sp. JC766 TaxID=3232139 RepID=UPI003459FD91